MLGMAGSGKGTQAKLIEEKYGYKQVSAGDLLRAEAKKETERGEQIREALDKGSLVPLEWIMTLIKEAVETNEGTIFDGFPRSLEQAEALDEFCEINLVLSIEIPDEEAIKRLSKRRQCKECEAITTDKYEKCPKCEGELYQRKDDKPETIQNRLDLYHEQVEPLKEYYKPREIVYSIDGTETVEEIFRNISKIIDEHKE